MPHGIYLVDAENQLTELTEAPYDSESLLQTLLADHPSILACDAEESSARQRWLLVTREGAVPDSEDGPGRWSVDHVFLDQDAIPTLVEVKRSTDTRSRREVVGQMLDYAANALAYWPAERLKLLHESRCSNRNIDPAEDLRRALGETIDAEEYWQRAKTNLAAGRIRLVFVADRIPPELRRIVEFLNEQMDPAEVLAVEVRQYVGSNLRTLVPIVMGRTAGAEQRKRAAGPPGVQWDESRFMARLGELHGESVVSLAQQVLRWAEPRVTRVWFGRGKVDGSFVPILRHADIDHQMFAVYTSGQVEIYFQHYQGKPPFSDEPLRRELLDRLNGVPGVNLPPDSLSRRPSIPLDTFSDPIALRSFFAAFEWWRVRIVESS
jgi:hypothetical protein